MAESDVIRTGNTLHIALGQRREERHHQAEDQGTGKDQPDTFKTRHGKNHADHTGHVEGVVASQEDILQTRKSGDYNIRYHPERHNQRG